MSSIFKVRLMMIVLVLFGCQNDFVSDDTIPLNVLLIDKDKSERSVAVGFSLLPQLQHERRFMEPELTHDRSRDTKSHLKSTFASRIKFIDHQNLCYLDSGNKVVGCYAEEDAEPSVYIGMGYGSGPAEVRSLNDFHLVPGVGSYLYDGSQSMLKYLDENGREQAKMYFFINPLLTGYVNSPFEVISLHGSFIADPILMVHDFLSNTSRVVPVYLFPEIREAEPLTNLFSALFGYLVRVDAERFFYVNRSLGFFSMIDINEGVLWSRADISYDAQRSIVMRKRDDAEQVIYDLDSSLRSAYGADISGKYLVIHGISEGKSVYDFYDIDTGDYRYSSFFEGKGSGKMAVSIYENRFATLDREGIIDVYNFGFDMPE